jgi:hypothetical protein
MPRIQAMMGRDFQAGYQARKARSG